MNKPHLVEVIVWWIISMAMFILLLNVFITLKSAICFGTEKTIEDIVRIECVNQMPDYVCKVVMGR